MARTVYGPPRNNAYVAMLGLAVFGMVVSCAMLGLELSGYDPATPPPFQAVTLPKVEPRSPIPAAGGGTPAGGTPAPAPGPGGMVKADPAPQPPAPAPAPAAVPPVPKVEVPPVVAKAEPPKADPPKTAEDPSKRGPRPGFLLTAPPAAQPAQVQNPPVP